MSECSELMAKLNSIESKLNSLESRFIPRGEREAIIDAGGNKGKTLALAAILPLLGTLVPDDEFRRVINSLNNTFYAKPDGEMLERTVQRDIADLQRFGAEFNGELGKVKQGLSRAQSTADTAIRETTGLRKLWDGLDSRVRRLSDKIDDFWRQLTGKIDDVMRIALKALGLSDEALKVGRQALSLAGKVLSKVLWIVDAISAIFSIINAIDLRNRMNALENRVSRIETEISQILGKLFSLLEPLRKAIEAQNTKIAQVNSIANEARRQADNALRQAQDAQSTAIEANGLARQAFNMAVGLTAQVALSIGLATAANATANQALRTKAQPGPQGKPGVAGKNGVDGLPGRKGKDGLNGRDGRPGKDGLDGRSFIITLPGRPGRDGLNGRNGVNGAPGRPGRDGLPGRDGKDGKDATENPMNEALLRQIHAQTIKNGGSINQVRGAQAAHIAVSRNNGTLISRVGEVTRAIGKMVDKTWDFLQIDRVLSVLTYVAAVHNAYFLSRNIADTLFFMVNNVLELIGIEKADGSPLDVGTIVNEWLENAVKQAIGEETLAGIKETWAKHSRIYQAGANIVYTVRGIVDSTNMILETTGTYVAWIGNALRRFGVVTESAYNYMDEKMSILGKSPTLWQKINTGLENADNVTNDLASITGDVLDISYQIEELQANRQELNTAIEENGGFVSIPTPAEIQEQYDEEKLNSEANFRLETADPYTRVQ